MSISFSCSCGKRIQVADNLAGKKIRCSACKEVVAIPKGKAKTSAIEAKAKPKPPARPAKVKEPDPDDFDDDFDDFGEEEAAPAPAKKGKAAVAEKAGAEKAGKSAAEKPAAEKKGKSGLLSKLLIFLLGAIVGAGGAWFAFDFMGIRILGTQDPSRRVQGPLPNNNPLSKLPNQQPQGKDSAMNIVADVPTTAVGFIALRPADWWQGPSGKIIQQNPMIKAGTDKLKTELGAEIADIQSVVIVVPKVPENPDQPENAFWVVVHSTKPVASFPGLAAKMKEGKPVPLKQGATVMDAHRLEGEMFFVVAEEKQLVMGAMPALQAFVDHRANKGSTTPHPFADALKLAESKHVLLAGRLDDALLKMLPPDAVAQAGPLAAFKSLSVSANDADRLELAVQFDFEDAAKAAEAAKMLEKFKELGKQFLPKSSDGKEPELFALAGKSLEKVQIKAESKKLKVELALADVQGKLAGAIIDAAVNANKPNNSPPAQLTRNLKSLGLAMHSFNDVYKKLPVDFLGTDLKPLFETKEQKGLSWRVALLPHLDQQALYEKFKLDEPWDSPHNIKLLDEIPDVFRPVGDAKAKAGDTFMQVFVGPDLPFDGKSVPTIPRSFMLGTSNTLLIAESMEPVPWTKPADIQVSADQPLPKLGGVLPDGFFGITVAALPYFYPHEHFDDKMVRSLLGNRNQTDIPRDWVNLARPANEFVSSGPPSFGPGPKVPLKVPPKLPPGAKKKPQSPTAKKVKLPDTLQAESHYDKENGFGIHFPKEFTREPSRETDGAIVYVRHKSGLANINVRKGQAGKDPVDVAFAAIKKTLLNQTKDIKVHGEGDLIVDSVPAKSIEFSHAPPSMRVRQIIYVVVKNSRYYLVICTASEETFDTYLPAFRDCVQSLMID